MPDLTLALPPLSACPGLEAGLLTGQFAAASIAGYRRDVSLYQRFCGAPATALDPARLPRWRTYLAQHTALSPHTINRRLASIGNSNGLFHGRPAPLAAGYGQDGGLGTGRRRGWGCSGRTAERSLQTDANVMSAAA